MLTWLSEEKLDVAIYRHEQITYHCEVQGSNFKVWYYASNDTVKVIKQAKSSEPRQSCEQVLIALSNAEEKHQSQLPSRAGEFRFWARLCIAMGVLLIGWLLWLFRHPLRALVGLVAVLFLAWITHSLYKFLANFRRETKFVSARKA